MPRSGRVLSRFGWGTVQDWGQALTVRLDKLFAGSILLGGRPEEFIVPSNDCIIRILNVAGRGIIATAVFVPETLVDAAYREMPKQQNETRILLRLGSSQYEQSDPFGLLIEERYVLLTPWADRWAQMDGIPPNIDLSPEHLAAAIRDLIERMHSTSSGITYYVVLDTETKTVVWHAFLCETGWVAHPAALRIIPLLSDPGLRPLPGSTG